MTATASHGSTSSEKAQAISAAVEEVAADTSEIVRAVNEVASITEENIAATEEMSAASEEVAFSIRQVAAVSGPELTGAGCLEKRFREGDVGVAMDILTFAGTG